MLDGAAAGLEPKEPTQGRRNADGAAPVAAVAKGDEACRRCCGGAAAAAPRRRRQIPRIAGRGVDVWFREGHGPELRRGELAEDDDAGRPQARHVAAVEGRDDRAQGSRAAAHGHEANRVEVLDAHRHPRQGRRWPSPSTTSGIEEARPATGPKGGNVDEGLQGLVVSLDAGQEGVGDFDDGDFSAGHHAGEGGGREGVQRRHQTLMALCPARANATGAGRRRAAVTTSGMVRLT